MINNLIIGGFIYNEENRFLEKYLKTISKLTDKLIFIEDGSTDNSYNILSKYTPYIKKTNRLYLQSETLLGQTWWDYATSFCNDGDFIFGCDPDEILTDNSILHFEEELNKAIEFNCDAIGMYRYEMWDNIHYRKDKLWVGDDVLWISCIRYYKNRELMYKNWYNMKIHSGKFPVNCYLNAYPSKLQIKHLAYSTPERRKEKVDYYKLYDPNPAPIFREKYDSFLDKNPNLIKFKDNFEDSNE